ncbi:MAG: UDP-N-acetylglucosamine 1-carboxyvinyltransferase [Oscillospiraceae bacterium]|nr:UDP-N-acetylglucosamine 1-carboxyvinyltransferase [Oscillospiraceae bacterium]
MDVLRIKGGRRLSGSLRIQGAKNSALPILAASILAGGESVIHNCPRLSDVDAAARILRWLGCSVRREGESVIVDSSGMNRCDIPDQLMREMRSSVIFLGAILGRCGEARISYPGGCELGPRPIDMHIAALRAMGAEISERNGSIFCSAGEKLTGARINLAGPSVGATENAMLAACCCEGETVISNAACEPEIEDLQRYLVSLGAKITGAGTPVIVAEGPIRLRGAEHTVLPDRIAAATYMSAAAAAGGDIELYNMAPEHVRRVSEVLEAAGCEIREGEGSLRVISEGRLKAAPAVVTRPYPGFPTDAQPPLMGALLRAEGTSVFVENIFENRYRHAGELRRMGADIKTEGKVAIVSGVKRLHGCELEATDLRGGAALAVAALCAEGESLISGASHIDRGYENMSGELSALGADACRLDT